MPAGSLSEGHRSGWGIQSRQVAALLVLAVVLLGASVRLMGWGWGLPYLHHSDEHNSIRVVQSLVRTRDPNPHWFSWPSLPLYIQSVPHAGYVAVGMMAGELEGPWDVPDADVPTIGIGYLDDPNVLLVGRAVSMTFGLGIVLVGSALAWFLSRRTWVAATTAAFLAFEPLLVKNSRWMTNDIFAAFFATCAAAMAVVVLRRGRLWQYGLAGVFVGFAASSKYNVALVAVAIVTAHGLRHGRRFLAEPGIYIAAATSIAAFVFTTPGLLLTPSDAWETITALFGGYSTGHAGAEGNTAMFYANTVLRNFGPLLLLIPFAFASARIRRDVVVLLAFPALYFVFLLRFVVRFERTLLPAVPLVLIAAALGAWGLVTLLRRRGIHQRTVAVGTGLLVLALSVMPILQLVDDTKRHSGDHRAQAREWINANVSAGSSIGQDWYSPYLDENRFSLVRPGLILADDSIFDLRPEIIIVAEFGSGRYLKEPHRYPAEVARHTRLLDEYCLVADFGGYESFEIFAAC